jgi:hypothetical protein
MAFEFSPNHTARIVPSDRGSVALRFRHMDAQIAFPLCSETLESRAPSREAQVAAKSARVHTPTMTLKNAALLALIGTIMMTALLVWTFVLTFLNVLRDLIPVVTLLQSFVYAFGCFSVAVFFYLFHRAQ